MSSHSAHRRLGRSALAIFAGLLAGAALSLGTDQVLHVLAVYPPWGEPMFDPALNALALAYRCVYSVLASYIAARLAPSAPMLYALSLGALNFVVSAAGAFVTITKYDLGPDWYPVALALSALPCAWLGGALYRVRNFAVGQPSVTR
ncbi:MAG TPA: hypothetical protein VJ717_05150 [Gemmatimonadaceae bacterium]|nr:hypothetical protein [Gemmatimonadaceae bacterium]